MTQHSPRLRGNSIPGQIGHGDGVRHGPSSAERSAAEYFPSARPPSSAIPGCCLAKQDKGPARGADSSFQRNQCLYKRLPRNGMVNKDRYDGIGHIIEPRQILQRNDEYVKLPC